MVLFLFVLIELYKFMLTSRSELSLDTGGDCSCLTVAVGAALSVMEEEDGCIPASIADIMDDTVGDIAGMDAVFFG